MQLQGKLVSLFFLHVPIRQMQNWVPEIPPHVVCVRVYCVLGAGVCVSHARCPLAAELCSYLP